MMMSMSSVNTNVQNAGVCESLNQNLTAASRISILLPTTQAEGVFPSFPFGILAEVPMTPVQFDADLTAPRVAGSAKGRIKMAPNFDAPLEW
jgi:hypothetical protein